MDNTKKNTIIIAFIIFFGLLIAYSNHFNNGFHFDDIYAISKNVYITNLKNIPLFFKEAKTLTTISTNMNYRPMVATTLAVDYWLAGGLKPFYFHLSTFIWYIVLCVLIFFIFRFLLNKTFVDHKWNNYIAVLGSGLYALHTANAETINYILARSDVMSTLGVVASLAIYILKPNLRKYYFYIIPAVIGVFFKETVLVLPILLFFYIILFENDHSPDDVLLKKNTGSFYEAILKVLPVTVIILGLQALVLFKSQAIYIYSSPIYYFLTQTFVWVHYLFTFFLPFNLSADTDWRIITNFFDDRIIVGIIFTVIMLWLALKTSKKRETRLISFGIIWFFAALLPASLTPLAEVMNDHRLFFPFIGLMMSVVSAIGLFLLKHEKKIFSKKAYQVSILVIAVVILSSLAYGVFQRNKVWKNDETLWHDVTVKSPANARGLMNYGVVQMEKGDYQLALDYFERALVFTPYYSFLHINLGVLKSSTKSTVEAEQYFKNAILYGANYNEPYYFYSKFLKEQNRLDEAKQMSEKCLEINPAYLDCRYLLMEICQSLGLWDYLKTTAEQTLRISANDQSALKYLQAAKDLFEAIESNTEFVKKNPSPENYLNLSLFYYQNKLYIKSLEVSYEAIKLNPDYAEAYNNICAANNALKKYAEAILACEKAIELKKNYQLAKNNLIWAENQIKK